jgi:hypothetical protein
MMRRQLRCYVRERVSVTWSFAHDAGEVISRIQMRVVTVSTFCRRITDLQPVGNPVRERLLRPTDGQHRCDAEAEAMRVIGLVETARDHPALVCLLVT